jgi:hypothetical protein
MDQLGHHLSPQSQRYPDIAMGAVLAAVLGL